MKTIDDLKALIPTMWNSSQRMTTKSESLILSKTRMDGEDAMITPTIISAMKRTAGSSKYRINAVENMTMTPAIIGLLPAATS